MDSFMSCQDLTSVRGKFKLLARTVMNISASLRTCCSISHAHCHTAVLPVCDLTHFGTLCWSVPSGLGSGRLVSEGARQALPSQAFENDKPIQEQGDFKVTILDLLQGCTQLSGPTGNAQYLTTPTSSKRSDCSSNRTSRASAKSEGSNYTMPPAHSQRMILLCLLHYWTTSSRLH